MSWNGQHHYTVSIPKFIFIGYDKPSYKVAVEDGGALSWATPEIDSAEMINTLLNDKAEQQYIETNHEALQDQAKAFYSAIITSVDSESDVKFNFAA